MKIPTVIAVKAVLETDSSIHVSVVTSSICPKAYSNKVS
jgi:hypothetical protein